MGGWWEEKDRTEEEDKKKGGKKEKKGELLKLMRQKPKRWKSQETKQGLS